MSEVRRFKAGASAEDVGAELRRNGVVIIDRLVPEPVLAALWGDLGPYLARTPEGEGGFVGGRTRRCGALFAKSRHMAELIELGPLIDVAESALCVERRTLGPDGPRTTKPTMQLSVTQLIQIDPGETAQTLHRDDSVHQGVHPGPELEVNMMVAMTDFTEANGATRVVPGSHVWADDRAPDPDQTVGAEMKRGSVLIWLGSTWHGGGANRTADESRIGMIVGFTLGHLRQEENQYLVVPRETVKAYPKRVQDLLGYKLSPPFCGMVEMQEPSVVLHTDDFSVLQAHNVR